MRSELVERAQARRSRGLRCARDRALRPAVRRRAAHPARLATAAEDAVQEALIRGWRDLRSLRDPERFEAWMHRLLVNACHDQSRRSRRIDVEVTGDRRSSDPSPHDDYATVVQRDELERAFLQLSVEHRAVLVLTHYVGLPGAARWPSTWRIPVGTVYSRLHYGSADDARGLWQRPHALTRLNHMPGQVP